MDGLSQGSRGCTLEDLRKLWEWVKEIVTAEVCKDMLTLAKADREYTDWQVAALVGN